MQYTQPNLKSLRGLGLVAVEAKLVRKVCVSYLERAYNLRPSPPLRDEHQCFNTMSTLNCTYLRFHTTIYASESANRVKFVVHMSDWPSYIYVFMMYMYTVHIG
jgi:hypothetical protein